MGVVEKEAAKFGTALRRETVSYAGQAQGPGRLAGGVEDGRSHAPAARDNQPRIHGVAKRAGFPDSVTDRVRVMALTVFGGEVRRGQVILNGVLRQKGQDRQTCRSDAEGEPPAFVKDERTDWEGAVFTQQADGLITAANREKGALASGLSQSPDVFPGQGGNVVAFGRH